MTQIYHPSSRKTDIDQSFYKIEKYKPIKFLPKL